MNAKGMALLMVTSIITILSYLLLDFNYEGQINQIKIYNTEDRLQARYNAEAGLKVAMARLELYKEALNLIETNKKAKDLVPPELLNTIWNIPLALPIPAGEGLKIVQKNAIEKFKESLILEGELFVEIQGQSQKLNFNMLRLDNEQKKQEEENQKTQEEGEKKDKDKTIFEEFVSLLKTSIEQEVLNNEEFENKYSGVIAEELISAIKHYISPKNSYQDQYVSDFENYYSRENKTPKHAPLSSLEEILLIKGWDQTLLDLIKGSITIYPVVQLDLNKITDQMLRLLLPALQEEERQEFFTWRDDPDAPQYLQSEDDLKNYFVTDYGILNTEDFDDRIKLFKDIGISFGPSVTLFKVISQGSYRTAKYQLTAFVSLPAKPPQKYLPEKKKEENKEEEKSEEEKTEEEKQAEEEENKKKAEESSQESEPAQYLSPRVVEIYVG